MSRTASPSRAPIFFRHVHLHGGIDLILEDKIQPGKVFDTTMPLDRVADAYRAMDERRAIKVLLRP